MPLLTLTVQYGRTLEDSAAASSWRPSKRRRNLLRLLSLTIGSSLFLSACLTIDPLFPIPDVCQQFHDLPLTDLTAPDPKAVLEEVGVIKVDAWIRDRSASIRKTNHQGRARCVDPELREPSHRIPQWLATQLPRR